MPSLLDRIYAASPLWLQHLGVSAFGFAWKRRRYGGRFREAVREFVLREKYSADEWRYYQTQQLQKLLVHAAKHVPYYSEVFKKAGLTVQDLEHFGPEDLSGLPLLEKEPIRQNPDQFIAGNVNNKRLHTYLTSGTTGTPMAVKFTSGMHQTWSAAYEARCRRWAGLNYKMSRAMIGGRLVVPKARSGPPFWRYNLAERQLYMSAFHISPANVKYYVDAINKFKPDYLVGYASGHFFLARMICDKGLEVHHPKAVLTSSEKLTPEMRGIIEEAYGCRVFDAYSGVEACCLASECECHQLHISPDVGIIELLGEDGSPADLGEPGEIVATGLLNFEQPLIRYRTGDLAVLSGQYCLCGRQMPVLKELVGRLEDTVIGPDGREMVRFHGIFVGLPNVCEGQVIQESLSSFRLKLVVEPGFNNKERAVIRKRFEERLGDVELAFEIVDKIERTERGKFRAVISKVERQ
jgi:phenylacetate-CoA ligase